MTIVAVAVKELTLYFTSLLFYALATVFLVLAGYLFYTNLDFYVRFGGMVPAHFIRILEVSPEVRDRHDLSSLRKILHAAAPCPPEVKRRIMPPSKDLIGRELSTGSATIDAEHVAGFAAALRDDNPAYRGQGATAPPTYPIAFMA